MALSMFVAVPTHSGQVESVTAESLLQLQDAVRDRGYRLSIRFHSASVISMLRNLIVADFLSDGADVLFMLDADQGVRAPTVLRMIDREAPVVGCLYPKRRYNWTAAQTPPPPSDIEALFYRATEFVGALEPDEPGGRAVRVEQGFARATHVGAGAMLVRRTVFDRLRTAYPELKGTGFNSEEFSGSRFAENWGLFNPMNPPEGGAPLAEDFSFCRRWREAGGEILAEVASTTVHAGRHLFSGNYLDYMRAANARA